MSMYYNMSLTLSWMPSHCWISLCHRFCQCLLSAVFMVPRQLTALRHHIAIKLPFNEIIFDEISTHSFVLEWFWRMFRWIGFGVRKRLTYSPIHFASQTLDPSCKIYFIRHRHTVCPALNTTSQRWRHDFPFADHHLKNGQVAWRHARSERSRKCYRRALALD